MTPSQMIEFVQNEAYALETKLCPGCLTFKIVRDWGKNKYRKNGLSGYCKMCDTSRRNRPSIEKFCPGCNKLRDKQEFRYKAKHCNSCKGSI